jgi:hypothetical protein
MANLLLIPEEILGNEERRLFYHEQEEQYKADAQKMVEEAKRDLVNHIFDDFEGWDFIDKETIEAIIQNYLGGK